VDDGGPFNAVAGSFFPLLWGIKFDRDRTLANLDEWIGADALRIFGAVGEPGDSWSDRIVDPRWPDYQAVLRQTLSECRARGLRLILTLIADVSATAPTAADRVAHIDRVLDVLLESPEQVLNLGITNEGLAFDKNEALELVAHVRERTPFLVSSIAGVNERPATVFAGRTERKVTGDGGIWEHTEQPYDLKDTVRIGSDEEPIGPQSSVAEDDDPLRNTAHAVCAWVCRAPIYVYHCGAGIRFGGAADQARGRYANFYDQPSFAPTRQMLTAARDFLPPELASWGLITHSHPRFEGQYPFKTGPLEPYDPSGWFLKTYANRSGTAGVTGTRFAAVFLKIEKDIPLEAFADMRFDVSDLRGGIESVELKANERHIVTARGAVAIRGWWD